MGTKTPRMKFSVVIFLFFAAACSASPVIRITECKGQTIEIKGKSASDSDKDSKCMKVEPVHFTPVCGKIPEGFKIPEGAKLIPAKQLTKEEFLKLVEK